MCDLDKQIAASSRFATAAQADSAKSGAWVRADSGATVYRAEPGRPPCI